MLPKWPCLVVLSGFAVCGAFAGQVKADETATIRNDSTHAVELYLKWTHLVVESPRIVLAPGNQYTTRGPDGTSLFIRFNATPGNTQFPKELSYQVITRFTANPADLGVFSGFRNISPYEVNLFGP